MMLTEQQKEKWLGVLSKVYAFFGACLAAMILWIFVALNHKYVATWQIPVVIKSEKATRAVSNPYEKKIEAKFEGEGWKLLSLYIRRPEWELNLQDELPKDSVIIPTYPTAAQYIKSIPEGVQALEIEPKSLQFNFDYKATKKVPIRFNAQLIPKAGFAIPAMLRFDPDSVVLQGAKRILEQIEYWESESESFINLEGRFLVSMNFVDPSDGRITVSHDRLSVYGEAQYLTEVEFPNIEISVLNSPQSPEVTLIPNRLDMTLSGALSDLASLRLDSIRVSVDFNKIAADTTGMVFVDVRLPKHVTLRKVSQERVHYILRR